MTTLNEMDDTHDHNEKVLGWVFKMAGISIPTNDLGKRILEEMATKLSEEDYILNGLNFKIVKADG